MYQFIHSFASFEQRSIANSQVAVYTRSYFRLFEHLYATLEELSVPYPSNFVHHFAMIAFDSLPRQTFLMYMQKDIVCITESVFSDVMKKYCNSLDDVLIMAMIRKIHDKDVELKLLEQLKYS